jgi:hypothetical protein
MDFDSPFDEVVLFEMPSQEVAHELWLRLHGPRLAWLHRRDDTLYVAAVLRASPADLAVLLREVEAWLVDCGLQLVEFELDGRRYLLRGRPAAVAGTAE